jgi:hypothetical protein
MHMHTPPIYVDALMPFGWRLRWSARCVDVSWGQLHCAESHAGQNPTAYLATATAIATGTGTLLRQDFDSQV